MHIFQAAFDELPDDWRRDCEHKGDPAYSLGFQLFEKEWWYYEWENATRQWPIWDQFNLTDGNTDLVLPEGKDGVFAAGDQLHSMHLKLPEA